MQHAGRRSRSCKRAWAVREPLSELQLPSRAWGKWWKLHIAHLTQRRNRSERRNLEHPRPMLLQLVQAQTKEGPQIPRMEDWLDPRRRSELNGLPRKDSPTNAQERRKRSPAKGSSIKEAVNAQWRHKREREQAERYEHEYNAKPGPIGAINSCAEWNCIARTKW